MWWKSSSADQESSPPGPQAETENTKKWRLLAKRKELKSTQKESEGYWQKEKKWKTHKKESENCWQKEKKLGSTQQESESEVYKKKVIFFGKEKKKDIGKKVKVISRNWEVHTNQCKSFNNKMEV